MSSLKGIVKQIAVTPDEETVVIELICGNAYDAQIVSDDIISRLKLDGVLSLIVKVGATIESGAET